MISRDLQIQAKIDRLNSGVDFCVFDAYTFTIHFLNGGSEEVTLYKLGGIWLHLPGLN